MSMTVLITGASRGLGLEFAQQYLSEGHHVIATARSPDNSEGLTSLKSKFPESLIILPLDVTHESGIQALADALNNKISIDILINNAGIYGPKGTLTLSNLNAEEWLNVFNTNTIAPLLISAALLPALREGQHKKLIFVSSYYGSIAGAAAEGNYYYRSSKAALNMVVKKLSLELADEGFICISQSPGWVKTDMGGDAAELTPEQSITRVRKFIADLTPAHNGGFFSSQGEPLPW